MRRTVVFYGPKDIDKMAIVSEYLAMHNIYQKDIYQLSTLNIKDDGSPVDIWERDTELIVFPNIEYKHLRTVQDIASGKFLQSGTGRKGACQVIATLDTDYNLPLHFCPHTGIMFINAKHLIF